MILDFHQPVHRDPVLDSGLENAQTEEKTAAEKEDAGDKDHYRISWEEGGDILEDDGKDETQQDDSSPEDQSHLAE